MVKSMKRLFQSGAPFPIDRRTGITYTKRLAEGIKLWSRIDAVVIPFTTLLWLIGAVPVGAVLLVLYFAITCPIVMLLGFSFGCLQYLTVSECYKIVRSHLTTSR